MSVDNLNSASTSLLNLIIYPNTLNGELNISFNLSHKEDVTISILDIKGALIDKIQLTNLNIGKNHYIKDMNRLTNGSVYFFSLEISTEQITCKLIIVK